MTAIIRTVGNLKSGVAGLLSGTTLYNTTDLNNALERAMRTVLQEASIPEAVSTSIMTLYDGVYDYNAPVGIFGAALRDLRPLGDTRVPSDYVYDRFIVDFDRTKHYTRNGFQVTFEMSNAIPIMRVAQSKAIPQVVLDPMTSIGNWKASGTISNFVTDNSFYFWSNGSMRFNLATGSGSITENLSAPINLTPYAGVALVFLALQIPPQGNAISSLTSVQLQLGSSNANYYQVINTQGFLGSFTLGDWILVGFDLSQATSVGTPNPAALNYLNLTFNASANLTNVRVGKLWTALPYGAKAIFETAAIFQPTGSSLVNNFITNDNDVILLSDPAYNLFEHECALTIALQNGGTLANGRVANINAKLNGARARNGQIITLGLYDKYRADNPSEELRRGGNYYDD